MLFTNVSSKINTLNINVEIIFTALKAANKIIVFLISISYYTNYIILIFFTSVINKI